jgi:predicted metalloprotease with PDZ domain
MKVKKNWISSVRFSTFFTIFAIGCCIVVLLSGCSPRLLQPVVPNNSKDFFVDYKAELVNGPESTFHITVQLPPSAASVDSLCFPIQIPGSYEITKYGKYVDQMKAFDITGHSVEYEKIDSAYYVFKTSVPVNKITYTVHSFSAYKQDSVPSFCGARIKPDYCLINPYAVFGFFPKYKNMPIRIHLILPEKWCIGTSLVKDSSGYLYADSYYEMQDNPIIAGELSKSTFKVNEKNFFIYTFSESSQFSAGNLKRLVKESVEDADGFLNGFIPSNYCFLFSFLNDSLKVGGAHEHARSSLYSFSLKNGYDVSYNLRWIVRHELFHSLIPLYLQGDEISLLDFINSHPVSHLWFYEGLAQWSAFKMQLITGEISPEEYLGILRNAYIMSDMKVDSLDFLTLSRNAFNNKNKLSDVYRRGLLFGNMLDMYIVSKTEGKVTLRETLLKMKDEYPLGKSFDSDSIFSIISRLTHPDVKTFLESALYGNSVNVPELFEKVGIDYSTREKNPMVISELGAMLRPDYKSYCMLIGGAYSEAKGCGYKAGDTLLTVDGKNVNPDNFAFSIRHLTTEKPGLKYTAEVRGTDGIKRTINGTTIPYFVRHKMSITPNDVLLREIWLSR